MNIISHLLIISIGLQPVDISDHHVIIAIHLIDYTTCQPMFSQMNKTNKYCVIKAVFFFVQFKQRTCKEG